MGVSIPGPERNRIIVEARELAARAKAAARGAWARADAGLTWVFGLTPLAERVLTLGLGPRIDRILRVAPTSTGEAMMAEIRMDWLRYANEAVIYVTVFATLVMIPDLLSRGSIFRTEMFFRIGLIMTQVYVFTRAARRYPLALRFHYAVLDALFFLSGSSSRFVERAGWSQVHFYFMVLWHRVLVTCLIRDAFTASLVNLLLLGYCAYRDAGLTMDGIADLGISKLTTRFSVVILVILLVYATLRAKMLLSEVAAVEKSKVNHLRTVFHFVSHEYRNHFFAGSLALDSLTSNHTMTSSARRDVKVLERAHKNISTLMENILHLSRMEGERDSAWRGVAIPFSVSQDLLSQMRGFAETTLAHSQKAVHLDFFEDPAVTSLPLVIGSLSLLVQAMNNLISNAIKFTPNGGNVRVVADADPDLANRKTKLRIVITDTGTGIEPEALLDIFKPFKHSRAGNALDLGGSGLGLSFTERIVNSFEKGSITARSVVGNGSTFEVSLYLPFQDAEHGSPLAEDETPSSRWGHPRWTARATGEADGSPPNARSGKMRLSSAGTQERTVRTRRTAPRSVARRHSRSWPSRILIVDDSMTNRMMLRNYICRQVAKVGHTIDIIEASDGESAIRLVQHQSESAPFDAITMDQYMPGDYDGAESARQIRTLGFSGPIIGVTGEEDLNQVQILRDAGCDAIWQKGGKLAELLLFLGIDLSARVDASSGRARPARSQSPTPR